MLIYDNSEANAGTSSFHPGMVENLYNPNRSPQIPLIFSLTHLRMALVPYSVVGGFLLLGRIDTQSTISISWKYSHC